MVYGIRVSALVGTEGDAGLDAALNDLGMWRETTNSVRPEHILALAPLCSVCQIMAAGLAYDDGLCSVCREANDALMLANQAEATRLSLRVSRLFPNLSPGQTLAMAASIMRSQP